MAPLPSRIVRAAALAGVLAVATAGCDVRLETPPIERRTPTPTVALRDEAAVREQAVADAAEPGSVEATLAPERLAALGGVYLATPGATPSPSVSPSAAPSLADTVEAAITGALDGADAADQDDPSLAAMLRSIALSHAVIADAADVAGAAPQERAMPHVGDDAAGPWAPHDGTAVSASRLAELAVAHDRAAFAYEVAAAKASGKERERALARERIHAQRAAAILALPGVEDDRASLYDVPPAGMDTPAERAASEIAIETDLAGRYAALIDGASTADLAWILDASYDAWMQAASLTGFDATTIPALPGLAVQP
ncbi:DUF4439 domain-containing protein [Demequina soli]|uniref:DUF4439 domain-containing protein n=1 Tax=Demequina soli TaxID=1638987 RepID=UPI0007848478|nr:DUF4439 domain-containing protein [Demequina soli]